MNKEKVINDAKKLAKKASVVITKEAVEIAKEARVLADEIWVGAASVGLNAFDSMLPDASLRGRVKLNMKSIVENDTRNEGLRYNKGHYIEAKKIINSHAAHGQGVDEFLQETDCHKKTTRLIIDARETLH
jgi:hypothetical protein